MLEHICMLVRKKVESGLNNDRGWTPAGAKSLSRQEGKACSVINISSPYPDSCSNVLSSEKPALITL